jgi:hypothetical protein
MPTKIRQRAQHGEVECNRMHFSTHSSRNWPAIESFAIELASAHCNRLPGSFTLRGRSVGFSSLA